MADIDGLLTDLNSKAEEDVLVPDNPSCVFQGARLRNASNVAVKRWFWGVLFRNDNNPYKGEGGYIASGQEGFQSANIQRCAFRKVCGAEMEDGSIVRPYLSQVSDGQCYSIAGWIIYPRTVLSGAVEYDLLPDHSK